MHYGTLGECIQLLQERERESMQAHKPCMPFALPSCHCTSPSSPAGTSVCTTQGCLPCQHVYTYDQEHSTSTSLYTTNTITCLNSLNYFQRYSHILQLILKGCNLLHVCHQLPPTVARRRDGISTQVERHMDKMLIVQAMPKSCLLTHSSGYISHTISCTRKRTLTSTDGCTLTPVGHHTAMAEHTSSLEKLLLCLDIPYS